MHEWSYHGGRLKAAEAAWPDAPRPWIDLSTGLNPAPYPADALAGADWAALPDAADLKALEDAAAAHFGLVHGCALAVPGTETGIRLLGAIGLPGPVRHIAPAYGSYAAAFPGAEAVAEPAASAGGTLILANPNNPDGRAWPVAELRAIATELHDKGGVLVIDEAFADVTPEHSILPHLGNPADSIIVLRSFGKFFGLGGLRLGFVAASERWQTPLRRLLGDWPVSAGAIALGTAAYRDTAWIVATRRRLRTDAERLDTLLARHGLAATGQSPLFRLIETPDAAGLFAHLARHGLLTRPFDYHPRWLRLGLPGDGAAWRRLDQALATRHG